MLLRTFKRDETQIASAEAYARTHHTVENAVNDIESAALRAQQDGRSALEYSSPLAASAV
jgi:hypothetical protein